MWGVASPVFAKAVTKWHCLEGGAMLGVWPACGIWRAAVEADDTLQEALTAVRQGNMKIARGGRERERPRGSRRERVRQPEREQQ